MIEQVVPLLHGAQSVYIATHISPDGDALGSALGLAWALRDAGKQCTVACADPAPDYLSFLPGSNDIVQQLPDARHLIVVVDTGDVSRLGSVYAQSAYSGRPVINIDHHLSNTRFGTLNVIEPKSAAVGEMIYELVQLLGMPLSAAIATNLLTAIVTDTIGFRTPNTTPQTLQIAAALMAAGAPMSQIVEQSFDNRPLPVLRIWGRVLSTFKVEDRVAWATISAATLKTEGVREDEVKGLVNILRGTQGVDVAALIMENGDGKIKAEFRSNGTVNVADIATALGGGGHRAASGCSLPGPLDVAEQRIVAEIRKHL